LSEKEYEQVKPGGLGVWSRRLRKEPSASVAFVDAIDREALDSEVGFAAEHVRRYIASQGADDGWDGPRPIVVLYTLGKQSQKWRRHPLLCFEHEGQRFVVGSKGGEPKHPGWFVNLCAHPRVHVRMMAELYEADALIVSDAERAQLWPLLTARYPMFADYQTSTERVIPLVRLQPVVRVTNS
jgi:deazaflavin-dependent oxidoreductase (nitroreductase family)